MAEQSCLPQVQACVSRYALLDSNGVPSPGADNLYVSDSLVEMTVTPVYRDGTEIEEPNACDKLCVQYRGDDSLKRYDFTLRICTPDPFLMAFLSGGEVLTVGARKGFAAPPIGPITGPGISIELWTKRIDDGDLDVDSPNGWWVYPKAKNLRQGEWTHNNGAILPQFSGQLYENPNWFDGPLNDWPTTSDRIVQFFPCDAADVPTPGCGAQAVPVS